MDQLLRRGQRRRAICLSLMAGVFLAAGNLCAQVPEQYLPRPSGPPDTRDSRRVIADVQIVGNRSTTIQEIRGELETRVGQSFDPLTTQRDVRNLILTKKFFDVKVKTQPGPQPGTVIVIYEVFEFPKIEYVYFIGNEAFSTRFITRKVAIKKGDPMDPIAIDNERKNLIKLYKSKGYNKAQIELREGRKRDDRGAVFVIHEGPQQRVWKVDFVGNSFINDGRLLQQIESRPSKIKYITPLAQGYVDRRKIDEDVHRLTSYYRGFGYMLARVGREIEFDKDGRWANLRFVVDEGPRFRVRNISFAGNRIFGEPQLAPMLELKSSEYFDLAKMNRDVRKLTDTYGSVGFILADVQPSPRTLENTPEVDLVYDISEGDRYRVGRINVKIEGPNPHTRRSVALNRISIRPGDVVDIRKIRDSERRLRASGLFLSDPLRGVRPKIVFRELENPEIIAEQSRNGVIRGQGPEGGNGWPPQVEQIEVTVYPDRGPAANYQPRRQSP